MQCKVPQNVQLEDRILPFMTMRQLIVSALGGSLAYLFYLMLERQPTVVWLPPVALIGGLTAAIAFLRINDISFTQYVLYALERYLLEPKRHWIKSAGDIFFLHEPLVITTAEETKNTQRAPTKDVALDEIDRLSRTVDAADATMLAATTPLSTIPQPK